MPPKDYIVYIDDDGKTRVVLSEYDYSQGADLNIIGYVSSGSEAEAIAYGDQVLRKN